MKVKNTKNLLIYLGVPAAIVAAVTATWAMTDYLGIRPVLSREFTELKTTVAVNQRGVLLIRWQILEQKRKTEGLTAAEQVEFCQISRLLGIRGGGCI